MVNPLFLMGVPKSGTTLLQRVLASHPAISSASEPWILLPPIHALHTAGGVTEYGWPSCKNALARVCTALPEGRIGYLKAVATMARQIYGDLSDDSARYFLDKTPRYHLIADDLIEAFPDARFVFLWRNPVSLIASIILHNHDRIRGLRFGALDLTRGLANLARAEGVLGPRAFSVRYEDFVVRPEEELRGIMRFLELDYLPSQLSDFAGTLFSGGDRNGVARTQIETSSLERWKTVLASPARRAYALRLLRSLDGDLLQRHKYDKDVLEEQVRALRARWTASAFVEIAELAAASVFVRLQAQAMRIGKSDGLLY